MKTWLSRAVVAVIAGSSGLAAPAAQAATLTLQDARGDVVVQAPDDTRPKPFGATRVNADLVRATVTHGPGLIRVKLQYVDLRRDDDVRVAGVRIHTSRGTNYDAMWVAMADSPRGWHDLSRGRTVDQCRRGVSHEVDYDNNRVTLEVSRACLDRPKWVQVKIVGMAVRSSGEAYGDIAGVDGWGPREWSKRIRKG